MTTFVIRLYLTYHYMFENMSHKNQQISRLTIKKGSTRLQDILFKSKEYFSYGFVELSRKNPKATKLSYNQ
jgi:hypothetical protein